jgi:hypothetical protein
VLNGTCLPSDIIAFVVFCRLRYPFAGADLGAFLHITSHPAACSTPRTHLSDATQQI